MWLPTLLACGAPSAPTPAPPPAPWAGSRIVATVDDAIADLRADDSAVYFSVGANQDAQSRGDNDVLRVGRDGATSELVDGGRRLPGPIAVDDTFLYWAGGDAILRVPLGGGPSEVVVPESGAPIVELAVDADRLYWLSRTSEGFDPAPIRAAPKVPGGAPVDLTPPLRGANDLCVGEGLAFATPEGLRTVPKTGGTPAPLANGPAGTPVGLAEDEGAFYTVRDTALFRVPKDGSPAVELAPSAWSVTDLAVDDRSVWYFDRSGDDMVLKRVPKAGGPPETVDAGPGSFLRLAIVGDEVMFGVGKEVRAHAR